MALLIIYKI